MSIGSLTLWNLLPLALAAKSVRLPLFVRKFFDLLCHLLYLFLPPSAGEEDAAVLVVYHILIFFHHGLSISSNISPMSRIPRMQMMSAPSGRPIRLMATPTSTAVQTR